MFESSKNEVIMGQDTPKQPDNSNNKQNKFVKKDPSNGVNGQNSSANPQKGAPKKIVKKIVVKKNDGSVVPTGKKIVKKIVKKPAPQSSAQNSSESSEKKINYWEEIEKIAPSTPRKEETVEPKKIVNVNPKTQKKENTVIKSATNAELKKIDENTVKVGKKILRKKSRLKRIFEKYGVFLILFFVLSLSYLTWMHIVPAIMNFKISGTDINNFLQPKIGFKVDSTNAHFYTTPLLGVGVKMKNFKLIYPEGRIDDEKMLFLKARVATFEVPLIPLMMRTIKFNEFSLRSVNANLYQDKNGKYVYLEEFRNGFNPNAKKYLLEVPDIVITSYNMPSYNAKTGTMTKKRGAQMIIPANTVKKELKSAPKSTSIIIR